MKLTLSDYNYTAMKFNFLTKFRDIAIWLPVLIFLLILPAVWADNALLDASLLSRQLALAIILPVIAAVLIFIIIKGFKFTFSRSEKVIFGGLAFFMLMHFLSFVNAVNYHEAIFRTAKEFMFCTWFFFVYQLLVAKPEGRIALIKSIVLMGCVFVGIALVQLFKTDFSSYNEAEENLSYFLSQLMEKVYSTCSNKNLLASILFLITPLAVYCAIYHIKTRDWKSIIWISISALLTICSLVLIVLLLTRAVYAALLLTTVCAIVLIYIYIFIIKPRKTGNQAPLKIKIALVAAPISIIVLGAAVVGLTETKFEQMLTERIMLTINPEKYHYRSNETGETAIAMRTIIWSKTAQMIKEHPLIGSGAGQWQIMIPKYGVDEFNEKLREGTLTYQRPHNDFLWYAAEVGIPGLIGYLVFLLGTIYIGIRNILRSNSRKTTLFNVIAVSTLIGMVLIMSIDYPHERIEHNIVYLTIAALILADAKLMKQCKTKEENPQTDIKPTIAIMAVGIAICAFGLQQSIAFFSGEHNGRRIWTAHYNKNWNLVMQLTHNIEKRQYTLNNFTVPMLYYRGFAESMLKQDDASIADFQKALELHPYNIITLNALGTAYNMKGDNDKAIQEYNKVLTISPRNVEALTNIALSYYNKKEFGKAIEHIGKVNSKSKYKPTNYQKISLAVSRYAAIAEKDLYNEQKLNDWLKNDSRVAAALKKYQSGEFEKWSDVLLPELGK
ncbi:MAG: O-antigen ligase family protein [Salinivirgaceae bacterium]|nr:O-antigen ligase family protein [Salinivirgaceae bacterium]